MSGLAADSRRAGAAHAVALALLAAVALLAAGPAAAQGPPVHYRYDSHQWPPGAIGQAQLQRGGPIAGYFQPVEIRGPEGLGIWLAEGGMFQPPEPVPVKVGMLVGQVYRFKVTGIHLQPGAEIYPTIEVIDRLYPPAGAEWRHPIPIELTQEELEMALAGKLVTRVIYIEDPEQALPVAEDAEPHQRYYEVGSEDDPLQVADLWGRPVAILRLGSRVPDAQGPDAAFLYGCPPLQRTPADCGDPTPAEVTAAPPRQVLPGPSGQSEASAEAGISLREMFPTQRSRR